jgi:hypothetical protein
MVPVDPQMIQHPTNMQMAFNPNGIQASMARGNNVYMGGLPYAPNAGRPRNATLNFGQAGSNPAFAQALQNKLASYSQQAQIRQQQGGV